MSMGPGSAPMIRLQEAPWRLSGVVYGALLNHPAQLQALGETVHQPPYKFLPRAPVLSVMPRHMQAADGDVLWLPPGEPGLEVGAALGIVLGRTACRVAVAQALDFVAAYVLLGEVSLPLNSHYRPAVRLRARDGFCPMAADFANVQAVPAPDALAVQVAIDGVVVMSTTTGGRVRSVAQLLADVTEFMTLQPGDVLSLGRGHGVPLVGPGQTVRLSIEGLGSLQHRVMLEGADT